MCWSKFSFVKEWNSMIRKTWSALPFTNERTEHHFTICADQDCPSSMTGTRWFEASALPFTNERTDHHFTICADQDFPFSKTETRWFEAHDRHCHSPAIELITTLRFVLINIFLSQRRKLDDLKHMIGIAFHQWKNWSPFYDMCWSRFSVHKDGNSMIWSTWSELPFTSDGTDHHFTICADQDSPFSKTETWWFEAHDRHCLSPAIELSTTLRFVLIKILLSQRRNLGDLKHMIGTAFHQWKTWSPLYDLCWSRFSCLKGGNSMIWSTWSALPFTSERTDGRFTICADQDCPSSKDGDSMIWSTWSALPFTNERTDHNFVICADQDCPSSKYGNSMIWSTLLALPFTSERTDHHFTICADQDFPFSKTETRWFEAHYRHCLSPMKELITTSRYVLNKIFFLKAGNLMIWSTWSALPFTSERTDHHFTICAEQDFLPQQTETRRFEAHDRHCLSPMKELITTLRYVLNKIFLSQRRKLDDSEDMIGIAFTNERTEHHIAICADQDCPSSITGTRWFEASALPFTNERTDHHFTICADQDFPFSKTETWWFEAHDRHCLSPAIELITTLRFVLIKILLSQRRNLDDLKHMIGTAIHQWKTWSPLYDDQDCPSSKDGNSMIWSTWSELPFTSDRTDHHFTICADQDSPFSKTETWWFEAHDQPAIELITTLRFVLIKILLSQRRNLDDLKHMIGTAIHQWKTWSPLYDMCWSRLSFLERRKLNDLKHMIGIAFHQWKNWSPLDDTCWIRLSFLKRRDSMIWSTWSALPFTNERNDHRFKICAD